MLRALGLLHHLEHNDLLGAVDESIWRALMIACGRCGGAPMREVAIAIHRLMQEVSVASGRASVASSRDREG